MKKFLSGNLNETFQAALNGTLKIKKPKNLEPIQDGEIPIGILPKELQRVCDLIEEVEAEMHQLLPTKEEFKRLGTKQQNTVQKKSKEYKLRFKGLASSFANLVTEEFGLYKGLESSMRIIVRQGYEVVIVPNGNTRKYSDTSSVPARNQYGEWLH